MKILFLPKWYPNPDDPQLGIFIRKHAKAVAKHADVAVLYAYKSNSRKDELTVSQEDGFVEILAPYHANSKIFSLFKYLAAVRQGMSELEATWGSPDILHAHVLTRPAVAGYRYFQDRPLVISEHWSGFVNGRFKHLPGMKKRAVKRMLHRASAITAVSGELSEAIEHVAGDDIKVSVIPNVIESITPEANPHRDRIVALTVADLYDPSKNVSSILRSMAKLESRINIELQIVGDGPDRDDLEQMAKDLGIFEKSVYFVGRRSNEEVLRMYHTADMLISNSNYETFGMVPLEALASGIPIISTRSGVIEEYMDHQSGILINPADQQGLTSAIEEMSNHLDRYDPSAASTRIREELSPENVGKQFMSIYESI